MEERIIVSKINELLHAATQELYKWLNMMLPRVTDDWWQECVIGNLSYTQRQIALDNGYSQLDQFDLAALLRITDKSWYGMRTFAYLPTRDRECVRAMAKVRNNWAHVAGSIPDKDVVIRDLETICDFFECIIITNSYTASINELKNAVATSDFSGFAEADAAQEPAAEQVTDREESQTSSEEPVIPQVEEADEGIKEKDRVFLVGDPNTKGMVWSVSGVGNTKKYEVFVDGDIRTFYEGQIRKIDAGPKYHWVDISTFRSNLSAFEINNPSSGNLYSLNAARIDFVPYQFRPALKMIKADEPKILIADSVGVGKTIEAGLIIKEMEARTDLDNVLIICPKPLVAERKWELEMKRFDEDFVPLDGQELRQILSDTHRDEEWPSRYSKSIIPYSILDSRVYEGEAVRGGRHYGLLELDPPPHFDLVIIDEAHHIRNGSLEKEKAYAYKCVRYFCEHADAVVMLTATPLQTGDDDLFTLLNLLRPDVVMDKEVFETMAKPNAYIYRASHAVRAAEEGWQEKALQELTGIKGTHWGENVVSKNPIYENVCAQLRKAELSREDRVRLVTDIESLHSFNTMLNRTRRRDIQDFCIRRSFTVETSFTPIQAELHMRLLSFEYAALSQLHGARSIPFMMSTIQRQAASSIFGLAPFLRDMITRRFDQMVEDPEIDMDDYDLSEKATSVLMALAQEVLRLADALPTEDPKFDSIVQIIEAKQKQDNNKIILFSSFRHTLNYLYRRLSEQGYRVAQITGSVKDETRRDLRTQFELDRSDPEALDILLFTEVGSEGLDYQFCDTMINYDLPWNPMRIEQRIGRIDRRGQKSEAVNIYNIITAETVDADIYNRCLMRIGIFERSIGECEEVLGEIGSKIEQIAVNTALTPEERRRKLEQMADNEVRRLQEMTKLEEEEKALFGFDLSNYTAAKEIKDAESPWISAQSIQNLVQRYLSERLGAGQYILGNGELKQLRLSKLARQTLLEDFRRLSNVRSGLRRRWENYLKGTEAIHKITFVSECAVRERKAFFITPMHPLVKQAAEYLSSDKPVYLHLMSNSDDLPEGSYLFSVFAWNYAGLQPAFKVVPVCSDERIEQELIDVLLDADSVTDGVQPAESAWAALEEKQVALWQSEKARYQEEVRAAANYKLESISSNYRNRKRNLERKIADALDERLIRMYSSELSSATENYNARVEQIESRIARADIYTSLVANGVLEIRR